MLGYLFQELSLPTLCVCVCVCVFNHSVMSDTFVTFWTVAQQPSLSLGLFRQEYWSGLPFPSPGDLPNPGIKPTPPALPADSLPLGHQESPY